MLIGGNSISLVLIGSHKTIPNCVHRQQDNNRITNKKVRQYDGTVCLHFSNFLHKSSFYYNLGNHKIITAYKLGREQMQNRLANKDNRQSVVLSAIYGPFFLIVTCFIHLSRRSQVYSDNILPRVLFISTVRRQHN